MSDGGFGFDRFIDLGEARRLLGLTPGADVRAIRRAYADTLRAFDVDADPQGFADLREARDVALADARERAAIVEGDPSPTVIPDLIRDPSVHQLRTPEHPADTSATPSTPDEEGEADDASPPTPVTPDLFRGPPIHDAQVLETATAPTADPWTPEQVRGDEGEGNPHLADHARAFAALLAGDEANVALTPDEAAAAHAHLDALFADPQLDLIEYRAGAEHWYADVAADAGPRADPVVPRIVAFFGWARDRGRFDQPPAQAAVLERADLLAEWDEQDRRAADYREELEQPHHYYHHAWLDLSSPRRVLGIAVPRAATKNRADLLETLRVEHPALHDAVVPRHPRWWVKLRAVLRAVGVMIVILVLAIGAGFLLGDPMPPGGAVPNGTFPAEFVAPATGTRLTTAAADMDPMLRLAGGDALSIDALTRDNPRYLAVLLARWTRAKNLDLDRPSFMKGVLDDVEDRYAAALRTADYRVVAWARRLRLDQLVYARDTLGTLQCGDILNGQDLPSAVADHDRDSRRQLFAEVILGMDGAPEPRPRGTFEIPGAAYEAAARRAKMTPDAFGRALGRQTGETDACNAWIALHEEALKLPPRQGLKLLREM